MEIVENKYTDISIEDIEFKTFDNEKLYYRIFKPVDWKREDKRSCIILYFGGGFIASNIEHFRMQSEYFAHKGMVCITPIYRTANKHELGLEVCYKDALAAFDDIINNADTLGIDVNKVVISGGSAGGTLANYVTLKKYNETSNKNIPCAQILFNPKLYDIKASEIKSEFAECEADIVDIEGKKVSTELLTNLQRCYGEKYFKDPTEFSGYHMVKDYLPKTIIFQGTYDPLTYKDVLLFENKACELNLPLKVVYYKKMNHGFFNWNKSEDNFGYYDTLKRTEEFLVNESLL